MMGVDIPVEEMLPVKQVPVRLIVGPSAPRRLRSMCHKRCMEEVKQSRQIARICSNLTSSNPT